MARRNRQIRRTAGFTLIELMVALVAGAIAITSIYFVSSASSKHFHEQQRIAQNQMTLRTAMAQIRRDFGRAGYMATPNTLKEDACGAAASALDFGAIFVEEGAATSALGTGALTTLNGVSADRVELFANFATGDGYKVRGTQSTTQLAFATTWQGFRRSFGVPYDDALFDTAFKPGRYVLVSHDAQGYRFFAEITAVSGVSTPPTITFDRALPGCFARCGGSGCTVSPVSRVEYTVQNMSGTLSTLASTSPLLGTTGPVLVRRELDFADPGVLVANSERVIAEYVADFDVDIVSDNETTTTGTPNLVLNDDAAAETITTSNPHRARTAVVRLSVRTAAEDQRFPYVTRTSAAALTRYELDTAVEGAARVRTSTLEVLLPNVAARNIRP